IDVGMVMTARSQAQNSADAGALAGATALVYDDFNNRTPTGPAVTSAIAASLANKVMGGPVTVTPPDVTFPTNPTTGVANRVQVTVFRQVNTLIAKYFQIETADIRAVATAEA